MDKMDKMKEENYYGNWKFNELNLFSKNYKSNNEFLNNFFGYYKSIQKYDIDEYIKNEYLENEFLKILIKREDEYLIIKYMKRYNLDYKKLYREFS